ncbi:lysosomal Pro-X carboxypeptidase isoform X1 [Neodiprion fabricii]|uniref:lysosomal Pro-X carboxypeptidase isoform X1 n=2 Tax=Neodiprion fabricii TaxID=2872261 RepID=UPI001ED98509|nr:lysosomal Pro-X carboxypeptidase isoform X1 [Neodiprion fabricii]
MMDLPTAFGLINALFCCYITSASSIEYGKFKPAQNQAVEDIKYDFVIKKFRVPLDHFSFSMNATFEMRYLVNDTWQRGNDPPIFFYTGNEGDIELFAQNTGFMWEIAPTFGACLIFAEHRYYGKSMPFGNESYSDSSHLGYLTSQQALADYADLISFLKSASNMRHSSVIVFGGSYGGMLSAWMRMKYPHLVKGAIAASAPILQFTGITECGAFARVVTSDFRIAHPECPQTILKSWTAIANVTSTENGRKWFSENWKLCQPLKNSSDIKVLKDFLTDIYGNLAMVNYPYASNFLAPLPAYPISKVCSYLTNSNQNDMALLLDLNKAISVFTNGTGNSKCLSVSENSSPNLDSKGWSYQSCTEMVMPMCTNGVDDMFEKIPWDFKKFSDDCYQNFKSRPQPYLACEEYGCQDLSAASNIVFSNGLLDPWSTGGVLSNVSSSTVAILIPEGAHHLDLRASNPHDPSSVIQTRQIHCNFIKKWIHEHWVPVDDKNTVQYEIISV